MRRRHAVLTVVSLALLAGCATTIPPAADEPSEQTAEVAPPAPEGPWDAAQAWAQTPDAAIAPAPIRATVAAWPQVVVLRVYAADGAYRAVVAPRDNGQEVQALLLHIDRRDDGQWTVVGAEETTTTHLWPQL